MSILASIADSVTGGGGGDGSGQNSVSIGSVSPGGTNAVALSSPHIVQYPRPPKRDDGRWIALSSVIGSLLGKLSSQSIIKEARDAENKWRDVLKKMHEMADTELNRIAPLRDKAKEAMSDLDKRNGKNWQRSDIEFAYGEQLKPCIDDTADALCALTACGYTPDYAGIYTRVAADAALAEQKELDKLCRVNTRYNTGWNCNIRAQLAVATQNAVISQTGKLRMQERDNKHKLDYEMKKSTFSLLEQARQGRQTTSQNYDKTASAVRANQYAAYTTDAQNSLEKGAALLASYGQNAAWLSESLRKTAKEAMADWGTLATMIVGLLFAWNAKGSAAKSDDCGSSISPSNAEILKNLLG